MNASLPDGETLFRRLRAAVPKQARLAFVSAFLIGLVTHLYMLVNKLPNHDDIMCLFTENEGTFLGRWFLFAPAAVSSEISVPWVNGLLSLLCLAVTAALVVQTLDVRRPVMVVLTGAVLLTFPSTGYTLCHMYVADAHLFAQLLAIAGVYLADRYKWGFLPGGLLIGLSMGCYQAYVFSAVALMGIRGVQLLIRRETGDREALIKALRFVLLLAVGGVVYRLGLEISLRLRSVALSTHMGLDQVINFSIWDALKRVPDAYRTYFSYMRDASDAFTGRYQRLAFAVCHFASMAFALFSMIRSRKRSVLQWVLLLALLAAMPLMFFGVCLVSARGMHGLMQYGLCFPFCMTIALFSGLADDTLRPIEGTQSALRQWVLAVGYGITLATAVLTLQWGSRTNQMYLALELKKDNLLSLANRIVDRVEQLPEYVPEETPVWLTGRFADGNYAAVKHNAFAKASATDASGREDNYTSFFYSSYFKAFVNYYIGVTLVEPDPAMVDRALSNPAYEQMPCFPYAGSVRYIDGIIVIKAGPYPQQME